MSYREAQAVLLPDRPLFPQNASFGIHIDAGEILFDRGVAIVFGKEIINDDDVEFQSQFDERENIYWQAIQCVRHVLPAERVE